MTQPAQHQPHPPPEQTPLVAQVARILLATAAADLAARAISRIAQLPVKPLMLALRLTQRGTNHRPRLRGRDAAARQQQAQEVYFRAAYILSATQRLAKAMDAGKTPREAVAAERRHVQAHEAARKNRQTIAKEVDRVSDIYGDQLGWWAQQDGHATPECKAAGGTNFRASQRPLIGWPGSVHPRCRCRPGPPFATERTVDQATARMVRLRRAS